MKRFIAAASLVLASLVVSPGARGEGLRPLLISHGWEWVGPGTPQGMHVRFWPNGAITPLNAGNVFAVWKPDGARAIKVHRGPKDVITLEFGPNLHGFTSKDVHGKALQPLHGLKKHEPELTFIPHQPEQSRLDALISEGDTITQQVFVPLDAPMHDPQASLARLREDLVDESALHPVADVAAYTAALRLCSVWENTLAERRDRHAGYAMDAPPSMDLHASKKQNLGPKDWGAYIAELEQEVDKLKRDAEMQARTEESQRKSWADRCSLLRLSVDNLTAQVHQLRSSPPGTSAAAAKAK